jgi:hypothetical protein
VTNRVFVGMSRCGQWPSFFQPVETAQGTCICIGPPAFDLITFLELGVMHAARRPCPVYASP